MKKKILAAVLAASMLLTACGGGVKATTMHLKRTEGTVAVSDDEGKDVAPADDLGLYSGYGVDTQSESYAWVDLDEVKLTKLDQETEIQIVKEDRHLTIEVKSGALFFNVTEPLKDDETLDIRASTMVVGIRGTCGWVEVSDTDHMNVYLLEGTVEVTAGGNSKTVTAGEMAAMTVEGEISVSPFFAEEVPAFVLEESGDIPLPEVPDPQVLQEQLRPLVADLELPLTVDSITYGVTGIEAAKSAYLGLPYAMSNPIYRSDGEGEDTDFEGREFDEDAVYACFGMNGMPIPDGYYESQFAFLFAAPYTGGGISHIEICQPGFLCLGGIQVGDSQENALALFGLPDTLPPVELTWTLDNGGVLSYAPDGPALIYQLNEVKVSVYMKNGTVHIISIDEVD